MISSHILVASRFLRTCSQQPTPVARGTTRGHLPQKDGQRPASLKTQAHGNQDSTNVATRRRSLWSSENLPIECQSAEVKKEKKIKLLRNSSPVFHLNMRSFFGRIPDELPSFDSSRMEFALRRRRSWDSTALKESNGANVRRWNQSKTQPFEDDCISKKMVGDFSGWPC